MSNTALKRLSFCIPTYNFAPFLPETLDSILAQLTPEVEVVLLDGGSTDDTAKIALDYAAKWPQLKVHLQGKKGGIDRDIARAVALAKGEYVWLFSSDDVLRPGALLRALEEIQSGHDVYLAGFTICGFDIKKVYGEHPIFSLAEASSFDLSQEAERRRFFEKAVTTTAFFSFMGSLIIKKERWEKTELDPSFYGSCWAHAARIFTMAQEGLRVRYVHAPWLWKRGFNDSFLDQGVVHRFAISIEGYHRIGEAFFGKDSFEARQIRRTVCREIPLTTILISGKSQIKTAEEAARLDALVEKLFSDPGAKNWLRKKLYFSLPPKAVRLLAWVHKHRGFFKHIRYIFRGLKAR